MTETTVFQDRLVMTASITLHDSIQKFMTKFASPR